MKNPIDLTDKVLRESRLLSFRKIPFRSQFIIGAISPDLEQRSVNLFFIRAICWQSDTIIFHLKRGPDDLHL